MTASPLVSVIILAANARYFEQALVPVSRMSITWKLSSATAPGIIWSRILFTG
ncbi:hypothetical protein [Brenneria alni]|uniref:hypothetical protein n=1 Tax=Brenneria alni TaxID=71656 RepID=UPI00196B2CC8|nr:hypothetical protein [Brenneria alni]